VELEFMPIWLQVHKLLEGYRKSAVVKKLVSRVAGEVTAVEMIPAGYSKANMCAFELSMMSGNR
jgi:hypothetical protein